jgi:extracellular factor (EF) 3-hydroxypalmitic acid methyl ester biosynthesis protein
MPNAVEQTEIVESFVSCENSQGMKLRATLLKLTRFQASFEVYSPPGVLRLSEALNDFRILIQGQLVYSGRAVVSNLIHFSSAVVCEATLDEACLDVTSVCPVNDHPALEAGFQKFMADWSRSYKVHSEFKVVMADMQSMFMDLRLWMEQMELAVRSQPNGDRSRLERDVLEELRKPVLPAVSPLVEKFESLASQVEPGMQAAHRAYMKRQIHPLVLCSPFLYRTFKKPLGYAGDYEMVNMMLRDPYEGGSMFAKLVNRIFLDTAPVLAHQKRIVYLTGQLRAEAAKAAIRSAPLRVFNLGCGPAREIQIFMSEQDLSDRAQFTLVDFDEETLAHTAKILGGIKSARGRATSVQMVRKSVHQLIKESGRPSAGQNYDFIYCAGLFDYLSDPVCKRLMNLMYGLLSPGGLVISTNVSGANPSRNWMEYVLDWHLLYRDAPQFASLRPDAAPPDSAVVVAIGDGVNLALEVRKPPNGN